MNGGAQLRHAPGWLLSVLLALAAASAQAAELPASVQAALEQAGLPATALGVVAFPLDEAARHGGPMHRTPALRWQAERSMAPSSAIKILSAVVALDRLGAASRGRTELLSEGPPDAEGRLAGPLYLRGGADAQLDWGALWLMLRQAREQGVRDDAAIQSYHREGGVENVGNLLRFGVAELAGHVERDAALQALDLAQAAVAGDVAGLARPRRNSAEPRQHQK